MTIDGVDAFRSKGVVWIDKSARRAVVVVLLLAAVPADEGGHGVLNNTLVRLPIVGLGLLLA